MTSSALTALAVVASVAAVPPATGLDGWALAGKICTGFASVGAALVMFFWKAVSRAAFRLALLTNGDDLRAAVCREFEEELAERAETARLALEAKRRHDEVDRRLDALDDALGEISRSFTDALTRAIDKQTEAMQRSADTNADALGAITAAVERVHTEAAANTAGLAKVVGYLDGVKDTTATRALPARRRKPAAPK